MQVTEPRPQVKVDQPLNIDSFFVSPNPSSAKTYISQALARAKRQKQEYSYRSLMLEEQAKMMRRHDIEMQKKFTLSFACLIFFFIGAPLGAIIKKGGIGTPLIISVILFIVYFIIDNAGYKAARDGKLEVWQGIWLSTAVLMPLGVFFTYKAVGDSAVFNIDAYRNFFLRLRGKGLERSLTLKEVRMTEVDKPTALDMAREYLSLCESAKERIGHASLFKKLYWRISGSGTPELRQPLGAMIDYLSNSPDIYVINYLNQYPFHPTPRRLDSMIETTRNLIRRLE